MDPRSEVRQVFFCRNCYTSKPMYRWQWVYQDGRMTVYSEPVPTESQALADLARFQASILPALEDEL